LEFLLSNPRRPAGDVLGVETEQETIGRNDFVDGKAKLLYLPARQLGV